MSAHSESLSTREHMSAGEYQAASWEAYDQQADPPPPPLASLSVVGVVIGLGLLVP